MFESIQEKGFSSVKAKLERTQYFIDGMRREQLVTQAWQANLDGFFFEIISAIDFFLQAINDKYKLSLKKKNATDTNLLMQYLKCKGYTQVFNVVEEIDRDSREKPWLKKLIMYRNAATHRNLVPVLTKIKVGSERQTTVHLYKDPEKGINKVEDTDARDYCQKSLEKMSNYLKSKISKIPENMEV